MEDLEMKLLIVSRQQRARSFDTLFAGLCAQFSDVEIHKLEKAEVHNIKSYLARVDLTQYDRVLFDIPLRRIGPACKALRSIQGLIFYEEDACQELVAESKYTEQFSKDFALLSNARIVVTSYFIRDYLIAKGIDAYCIPKAFDDSTLKNLDTPRDIALAFIGRTKSQVYNERRSLLESMAKRFAMQTLRTETPQEYLNLLNRIAVFISADIGFNEYMAKNFEAMACGCLLLAKRQPSEDQALGLIDMHNVVHYDTLEEAADKYQQLQNDPALLEQIARNGLDLVNSRHALSLRVPDFVAVIKLPAKAVEVAPRGVFERLMHRLTRQRQACH
ncbi:glycosyltransferase family 1 protein [Pseudomonas sp. PB120]|nr:glycosyltransferase family 1 protein [Pseudomonas sp. PB120]